MESWYLNSTICADDMLWLFSTSLILYAYYSTTYLHSPFAYMCKNRSYVRRTYWFFRQNLHGALYLHANVVNLPAENGTLFRYIQYYIQVYLVLHSGVFGITFGCIWYYIRVYLVLHSGIFGITFSCAKLTV